MGNNNDIAQMLALLHELQGIDFVRQLKLITERHEFTPLPNEQSIYIVGGETSPDFANLLICEGCIILQIFHTKINYAVYCVEQRVLHYFCFFLSCETREERALTGWQVRAGLLGN